MHNKDVSNEDLAKELGVTSAYVSMILNGKRNPPDVRKRMEDAFSAIVEKRGCQEK
jgi:predicted transcriptional regulator